MRDDKNENVNVKKYINKTECIKCNKNSGKSDNIDELNEHRNCFQVTYIEISDVQFNSPKYKNNLIKSCDSDYIAFINTRYTSSTEIRRIISEDSFLMNYDMIILGEGILHGDMHFDNLVNCLDMNPYMVILKMSVFGVTGSFNEQLECGDIYELSLRVAHENCDDTVCSVYGYSVSNAAASDSAGKFPDRGLSRIKHVITDNSNDKLFVTESRNGILLTYAYVITKYMFLLRKSGRLESVLDNMTSYASDTGYVEQFNTYVMDFLNNSPLFRKIEADTAPFYIIMGDDICYGVLKRFAICLTKEFIHNGQAVITSDCSYGKKTGLECIEKQTLKGIVGFQAPVLFREYFKNIKAPKYVFWFDHPMYFRDMMGKIDNSYYMLCQDEYYAEFMRKYYHIHNAIQFPPAGEDAGLAGNSKRIYDIVFIGSYHVLDEEVIQDEFQKVYYDYMMCNSSYTFEQGLDKLLKREGYVVDEEKFIDILCSLQNVCRKIVYDYRIKIIEEIIKSGIKIDVFGDTWKQYDGMYRDNLIIHKAVTVDEALDVWGHSKIGLNIMTWHKYGMTERIANICLSGAVCLTDSSEYLRNNFNNNENIIMYDLSRIDELPAIINKVLSDDSFRKHTADAAYLLAKEKHTWKIRTMEFLRMIKGENNK